MPAAGRPVAGRGCLRVDWVVAPCRRTRRSCHSGSGVGVATGFTVLRLLGGCGSTVLRLLGGCCVAEAGRPPACLSAVMSNRRLPQPLPPPPLPLSLLAEVVLLPLPYILPAAAARRLRRQA